MRHIKFPSINQFRNVIKHVQHTSRYVGRDENGDVMYDTSRVLPTLKFSGTTKLHGTNAGIIFDIETSDIQYQSRERILDLTSDNAGFMLYMSRHEQLIRDMFQDLIYNVIDVDKTDKIAIFGEWCGGNIQAGVALTQVPKMFVIFGVAGIRMPLSDSYSGAACCPTEPIEDSISYDWAPDPGPISDELHAASIYHINEFPHHTIDIDFGRPEMIQNDLVSLTIAVEEECPVAKHFGVSGVGEGIVWKCITLGFDDSSYWFKVKGEKHANSKVKTLAPVDVEAVASLHAFVDMTVTEARLEQGLHNLINEQQKPFEMTSMGDFLRWVVGDVYKEERDTMVANGIDPKKVGSLISNKARPWYISRYNTHGI